MRFLIITILLLCVFKAKAAYFETGSDVPTKEFHIEFIKMYEEKIQGLPLDTLITVEGHTDSRGSVSSNQALSEKRSAAVAKMLRDVGFTNVKSVGFGESQLDDKGTTPLSHANNRRVVIVIGSSKNVISEGRVQRPACQEKVVYVNKIKKHRHILSGEVLRSSRGLSKSVNGSISEVDLEKAVGLGIMYQNNIYKDIYLGGRIDTNGGVGINVGVGF